MENRRFDAVARTAGGLAMLLYPLLLMVGFLLHPQFLTFARVEDATVQLGYIQTSPGWTHGHVTVFLSLPIGLLLWLTLGKLLREKSPWIAGLGSSITAIGYIFMGGVFGSCLAQSALGTLPASQVVAPLQALIDLAGPMKLLYLELLSLIGPMVLAVGLLVKRVIPRWSSIVLLLGNIVFLVFMDIDGLMFFGALMFLVALAPLAFKLMRPEPHTAAGSPTQVRG